MNINEMIQLNEDLRKVREAFRELGNQTSKFHMVLDELDILNRQIDETQKQIDEFNIWADEQAEMQGAIV